MIRFLRMAVFIAAVLNCGTASPEPSHKEAIDLWSAHIRVIVAQAEGANVTRLRQPA